MPPHTPQWTDFLLCAVCCKTFNNILQKPISLACGHTVCQLCLQKLKQRRCPVDQSTIIEGLPVNYALLLLAGVVIDLEEEDNEDISENLPYHKSCCKCMEELATILKPFFVGVATNSGISQTSANSLLSRPMQRKLVTLFCCQLIEEEGRAKAARAARSIGERIVTELILHHQNPQQLSANLWAAVRGRGCQFLGPGMQEDVLRLILLALEDGSALSRKILVLFVVQKLENSYPQASKTAIGHVVQLLYRASCFKVTKQEESSSLMQLKDEYRSYESLRREHDAQIVHIATEAGLRISPEQWSSLLYGDASHKSHMQSIIDKLQTPQSFTQSINELSIVLQRSGDPYNLQRYHRNLDFLANIDPSSDAPAPSWENLEAFIKSVKTIVICLIDFIKNNESNRTEVNINYSARYKTSMCRDMAVHGMCPRFIKCTFAHSQEEMEKYRARNKKSCMNDTGLLPDSTSAAPTVDEKAKHDQLSKIMSEKLTLGSTPDATSVASTISVNTCSSTATKSLTDEENDDGSCTSSSRDREISPDSLSHLSATAASFIPTVEKPNLPQMQCKVATVSPHVHLPCYEKSVITTTQTQNAQSQTPPQCVHQHHFAPTVPQHPSVPNIPQHTGQPMHQMMHYGGPNNQIHPNWPGMIQNTMMQAYPDDRHPIQHGPSYVLTYPQTVQVEQCENCLRTNRMYHYPHDALCCHGIQQPVPHQMAYPPPPPTMYQQTRMDGSIVAQCTFPNQMTNIDSLHGV